MARKKTLQSRGARDPRGRRGPEGPPAVNAKLIADLGQVLARVTQELEEVQRTLRVQFTRIAQLQAEIDSLRLALPKSN